MYLIRSPSFLAERLAGQEGADVTLSRCAVMGRWPT